MAQTNLSIEKDTIQHMHLDYLRFLPPEYGQDPHKKWPLILFLHGAGERGDDLDLIKVHGIPRVVGERNLPFVTLSPQCPRNHWWSDFLPALADLVQLAVDTLNVDPQRVYLTGMSMGGYGTWHMAVEYPHLFAAIAPICGGGAWMYGVRERVCVIKDIPAWVFHGAKDDTVQLWESQVMVDALKACGGDVRFTVYDDCNHDSWTRTYNNAELYEWFLAHKKEA